MLVVLRILCEIVSRDAGRLLQIAYRVRAESHVVVVVVVVAIDEGEAVGRIGGRRTDDGNIEFGRGLYRKRGRGARELRRFVKARNVRDRNVGMMKVGWRVRVHVVGLLMIGGEF